MPLGASPECSASAVALIGGSNSNCSSSIDCPCEPAGGLRSELVAVDGTPLTDRRRGGTEEPGPQVDVLGAVPEFADRLFKHVAHLTSVATHEHAARLERAVMI